MGSVGRVGVAGLQQQERGGLGEKADSRQGPHHPDRGGHQEYASYPQCNVTSAKSILRRNSRMLFGIKGDYFGSGVEEGLRTQSSTMDRMLRRLLSSLGGGHAGSPGG